jgi:hypothetical protein
VLSPEEHAIMIDLSTALHCHKAPGGNVYDNAAVLDDPAWRAVKRQSESGSPAIARSDEG